MSLYRTELRRLFKRRLTRLMMGLLILGLAGIAAAFSVTSHHIGPAELASAQQQAEASYQQVLRDQQEQVRECRAAQERGESISDRYPPDCGEGFLPRREEFQTDWYLPYQFNFREEFDTFLSVFAGIFVLFAFIVGASFVGAEWSTGGMMNLLLWRPKRLTVLGTKLAALLTGMLGLALGLGALWTLAFWLIARYRGTTGKLTSGLWQSLGLTGARGLGLVLAVAVIAFGLASIGRHTAMALGVAVAVGVLSEIGLRTVLHVAGVHFADRYVLSSYALSWFLKKWPLQDYAACDFAQGVCRPAEYVVTWQHSAWVFGLGTLAVLVTSLWLMRRRDVA
ncbi:ABC transporter permease subunit [Plantactinospora sp. KBS50]|uniref:ABC transporter permease subunit n=1 Tax=Plantactinospora sp. KBS50 TaxID=2024580 RepID=UPI000BAB20A0|nr:ABC transporter permease subunit [Plantactinospora sp. KBS50]ASW56969.1 ABC transporter permease [Plantactinospora sp. KBS50]